MSDIDSDQPDDEYEDIDELDNDDSIELIFMYYNDYSDHSLLDLYNKFQNSFNTYLEFYNQGFGEGNTTDKQFIAETNWINNMNNLIKNDKSFIKKCITDIKNNEINKINISKQIVKNFNTHYDDMKNKQRKDWVDEVNQYIVQNNITIDPDQSIEDFTESLKNN